MTQEMRDVQFPERNPEGTESSEFCQKWAARLAQALAEKGYEPIEYMACKAPGAAAGKDVYVAQVHFRDQWGEYFCQGCRDITDGEPEFASVEDAVAQAVHEVNKARRRQLYAQKHRKVGVFEEVPEGNTIH